MRRQGTVLRINTRGRFSWTTQGDGSLVFGECSKILIVKNQIKGMVGEIQPFFFFLIEIFIKIEKFSIFLFVLQKTTK